MRWDASCKDFKTAAQENVFEVSASIPTSEFTKSQLKEWMKPVEAPLPKFLAASGRKGMVYREPYEVTLIICTFNGPLVLSLRPAVAALSAGNPCILKLSEALLATDELLLELIPKHFELEALSAVVGGREIVTNLLKLPFDFIFLTGSVGVGKVVMRAAAEHLTPVLLELGGQNPAIVDETANVPDAAKKIVWGAMARGGQWCTSPGYAVVRLALDGVSGDATGTLLDIVGWDAKIVCYAAPTREPIKVNPLGLVAKRASIHPFFMHYPENLPKIPEKIRTAAQLVATHQLRVPIAAVYSARSFKQALARALAGGKVLLDFTDES